jgi:hypothetical protein
VPIGTIVGISMIVAGVILLGVVIWLSISYRQRQKDINAHLDD